MNEVYLDRLGNELEIGDICVCYNSMRTGSSTIRMVQYVGIIERFTPKRVTLRCLHCHMSSVIDENFNCDFDNLFKLPDQDEARRLYVKEDE